VETIYKALAAAAAEGAAGKNGSDDEGGAQSSRLLDHIAQYLEEGIEFGESVLLPHESISESQVSMLRHDASILISNPSFRGVSDSGQAARHAWMLKVSSSRHHPHIVCACNSSVLGSLILLVYLHRTQS
jgi:hypothetical protein